MHILKALLADLLCWASPCAQVTLRDEQLPELLRLEAQTPWQMLRQGRGQYAAVRGASTQTGVLGRDVQEEEAQTGGC